MFFLYMYQSQSKETRTKLLVGRETRNNNKLEREYSLALKFLFYER